MEKLNENTKQEVSHKSEDQDPERQEMKEKLHKNYSKKYKDLSDKIKEAHQNIIDLGTKIENHTLLFNDLEKIPEMLEHISITVKLHRDLYNELEKTEGFAYKIEDVNDKLNNLDFIVTKKLDKQKEIELKSL